MVSVKEGPPGYLLERCSVLQNMSVIDRGSCLSPERGMVGVPGSPGPPGPPGLPGNLLSSKKHSKNTDSYCPSKIRFLCF